MFWKILIFLQESNWHTTTKYFFYLKFQTHIFLVYGKHLWKKKKKSKKKQFLSYSCGLHLQKNLKVNLNTTNHFQSRYRRINFWNCNALNNERWRLLSQNSYGMSLWKNEIKFGYNYVAACFERSLYFSKRAIDILLQNITFIWNSKLIFFLSMANTFGNQNPKKKQFVSYSWGLHVYQKLKVNL